MTPTPDSVTIMCLVFAVMLWFRYFTCLETDSSLLSPRHSLTGVTSPPTLSLSLGPEPEPGPARALIGHRPPVPRPDWSIPGLSRHCQGLGPACREQRVLTRSRGVIEQVDMRDLRHLKTCWARQWSGGESGGGNVRRRCFRWTSIMPLVPSPGILSPVLSPAEVQTWSPERSQHIPTWKSAGPM